MARKAQLYRLGSLISVQDENGVALAICRIEAVNSRGQVIGRFFPFAQFDKSGCFLPIGESYLRQFGDLFIVNGRWPVLGIDSSFSPSVDEKFDFFQKGSALFPSRIDTYDSSVKLIATRNSPDDENLNLPPSGLMGASAVEIFLKRQTGQKW